MKTRLAECEVREPYVEKRAGLNSDRLFFECIHFHQGRMEVLLPTSWGRRGNTGTKSSSSTFTCFLGLGVTFLGCTFGAGVATGAGATTTGAGVTTTGAGMFCWQAASNMLPSMHNDAFKRFVFI